MLILRTPFIGVYGGKIEVEIESTEDTSIIETMVNNQFKPLKAPC